MIAIDKAAGFFLSLATGATLAAGASPLIAEDLSRTSPDQLHADSVIHSEENQHKPSVEAPKLLKQPELQQTAPREDRGWIKITSEFNSRQPMDICVDYYTFHGSLVRTSPNPNPNEDPRLVAIKVSTIMGGQTQTIEVPVGLNEIVVGGDALCPWVSPKLQVNIRSGQIVDLACGTRLNRWRWKSATMRALVDHAFYDSHSDKFVYLDLRQ